MSSQYEFLGSTLTITPNRRISEEILPELHAALLRKTEEVKELVIDISRCQSFSSTEIGVISLLRADPRLKDLAIRIINVPPAFHQLVAVTGLEQFVTFEVVKQDSTPEEVIVNELDPVPCLTPCESGNQDRCELVGGLLVRLNRAEDELESLRQQLVHSEKISTLGQMAAGVAHEFNNLLAIMLGYTEVALLCPEEHELAREALNVVRETSTRASGVTEALLSFAGHKTPKKSMVDLGKILENQVKMLKNELLVSGVTAELNLGTGIQTLIDAGQMEQVFLNLMTNALHAMPKGGKLTLGCTSDSYHVIITVTDTGVGIPASQLDKIFAPFYTTKGAFGGGEIKGTGLGLSVSQGIVARHKGTLRVESTLGKGSTFTVSLPLLNKDGEQIEPVCRKSIGTQVSKKEPKVKDMPRTDRPFTILVVDDEEQLRTILQRTLTTHGHLVFTAASGEEAIQFCRESKPDILFLDMLMPGMNGADALLEIRKMHNDVAVAVITGQAGRSLEAMLDVMKRTGNIELIRKPFRLADIFAFIQKVSAGEMK